MPRATDLTNQRFGRLLVNEFAGHIKSRRFYYCTCDCGMETLVSTSNLTTGNSTSCGCLTYENSAKASRKHGASASGKKRAPEYTAWCRIKKKAPNFPDEWSDYQTFLRDVGHRPSPKHQIYRRDLTQPHSPNNTYWRHAQDEREQRKSKPTTDGFFIDMSQVREPD